MAGGFPTVAERRQFKLVYEEDQVDGKSVGIKQINAIYFEHFGNPYYASRSIRVRAKNISMLKVRACARRCLNIPSNSHASARVIR